MALTIIPKQSDSFRKPATVLRCLTLPGGACSSGFDFDYYPIQLDANNLLSADSDHHCSLTRNSCEDAVCRIHHEFQKELTISVARKSYGSYNWTDYGKGCYRFYLLF